MRILLRMLFRLSALITVLCCGEARAATVWYVSPGGNDANAGTNWALAKQTIQAGVDAAAPGDTVWVTNGIYLLGSSVTLTNAIELRSVNGSGATILDGQQAGRCVTIEKVAAILNGFTLRNGRAVVGGGIYCNQGTVRNCLVQGNQAVGDDLSAGEGGGVYVAYGVLSNCVIAANTARSTNAYQAAWGGGVYCYGSLMQDCLVSNNLCSADDVNGGGVVLVGGELRESRVVANSGVALSQGSGGGVYATIQQLSVASLVEECLVAGNSIDATDSWTYTSASANGGGLNIGNGTVVRSTLVEGNTAKAVAGFTGGGGVSTSGSTVENCTVTGNVATSQNGNRGGGGGVRWGYNDQCRNNIIWGNSADDGPDNWEVNAFSYPLFVNSDIGSFVPGTNTLDCITADPLFANAAGGDYRLQAGSPCLNTGTNLDWMAGALDLAGNSRVVGWTVDMGAYEYGVVSAPQLAVGRAPGGLVFMWPTNAASFTLQSATNLTPSAVWSPVSPAPVVVNGQESVTNPISSARMFYRLSRLSP